jgi:hypothetical protein
VEPRIDLVQLQQTFVMPPGLGRSRPRETRLTANGVALVIASVTLLASSVVVFVLLSRLAIQQADVRRHLAEHGEDAVAGVTRLWRSTGDSHQPWVAYQWRAGSLTYGGQLRLRLATWNTLHIGSPLAIRYDPSDPSRSVLAGTEPSTLPLWAPPLASSSLLAGGIACLLLLRAHRQLLRDGRAAPAVITKRRKISTQHGGSYVSIAYEFPLLSGATATGRSQASRNPLAVGGVICVVYDSDRPRRSMPYPFKLVKLA